MRKNLFLVFFLVLSTTILSAQDIDLQLLYSPGHAFYNSVDPTNLLLLNINASKETSLGSTAFFGQVNYDQDKGRIALSYFQLSQDFKIKKIPVMVHLEFDGQIFKGQKRHALGFSNANAYLLGPSFNHTFGKLDYTTYLAYKLNAFHKISHDIQWSNSWDVSFFDDNLTLDGFINIWTENIDQQMGIGGKKILLSAQPQFWYNISDHLAGGSEIDISNNFFDHSAKFYVYPTIAAKWSF